MLRKMARKRSEWRDRGKRMKQEEKKKDGDEHEGKVNGNGEGMIIRIRIVKEKGSKGFRFASVCSLSVRIIPLLR